MKIQKYDFFTINGIPMYALKPCNNNCWLFGQGKIKTIANPENLQRSTQAEILLSYLFIKYVPKILNFLTKMS